MSKTPSPLLFQLIKSLSGSEKGHFKKQFSNSKKHNLCICLFDAVVKQKQFDDVYLEKVVYENEKKKQHKYSELKRYTIKQILKSLHWYDENHSDNLKIRRYFLNMESFYKRGFLKAAKSQLEKAEDLANRHEDFLSLLECLKWEKEIAWKQNDFVFIEKEMARIDQKERIYQEKLKKVSAYRNMFLQMLMLIRKGESPNHKIYREQADNIMCHTLLLDYQQAQSYHSKVYFYRIHSLYAYTMLDWEQFYNYGKKLLEIMDSNSALRNKNSSEYISAFSNFMVSCSMLKRYEEMKIHLVSFKKIQPKNLIDRQKVHKLYYLNSFERCCRTGAFAEGLELMEQHLEEASLENFPSNIFETNSFLFDYIYIAFGNGDFRKTGEYFHLFKKTAEKEVYRLSKVMDLIIQVEEASFFLLEHSINNYAHFLRQQKETGGTVFQVEEVVKKMIRKVLKSSDPNALPLRQVYQEFKPKFEALTTDSIENTLLQYFDIIAWLDSKIEGISFSGAVRRRYLKNKELS